MASNPSHVIPQVTGQNLTPTTTRGTNYYAVDANLNAFLRRVYPDMLKRQNQALTDFGLWAGTTLDEQAEYSDRHAPPKLIQDLSKPGERNFKLILNEQYKASLREVHKRGIVGKSFEEGEPNAIGPVMEYETAHSDISTGCPPAMTDSDAEILKEHGKPDVIARFLHQLTRMDGEAKTGSTMVTEQHSGSDAGDNACVAWPQDDDSFRLSGQKWFVSNGSLGMSFVLARGVDEARKPIPGPKGLGVYIMPECTDKDWTIPNTYRITGLKDKLGTKGLATVEMDLNNAYAIELVPPPHGLRVMMEALGRSRVYNSMAAAGAMHRIFLEAVNWADYRMIKGQKLAEKPMTKKILIQQAVDWMAASALAFEATHSFDVSQNKKAQDVAWMRMVTAIAKFRTADMATHSGVEALNLFGGNGITADWAISRLVRDVMILSVWEGPPQVQALELARVLLSRDSSNVAGSDILINRMNDIARALPEEMKPERLSLSYKISVLKSQIDDLVNHPSSVEYVADDILRHAGDVLTYALLCHEAQWELANDQNPIKQMAAARFAEMTFGQRHNRHTDPAELTDEFNALVRGIIPPTWKPASQAGTLPGAQNASPSP
ncbi:MAG: acyl-CoA dehydrogenase, middle domain protein [Micavibrio sp.]|nr:acyl-CoA dehydrogenase, middle domain protein [Micavibrio sp.]